jgi:acid phosphatase type 7
MASRTAMLSCVRLRAVLALLAGVLACWPAQAMADTSPRLALSTTAATPGERVVVVGRGFPARASVRLLLAGRTLGRGRTGRRGAFRLAFRVPARAPASYRLTALSRGARASRRLRVLALPAPVTQPTLSVPEAGPPPAPPASADPPPPEAPTLVAAGDISCANAMPSTNECHHAATSDLVLDLAPDAVATLGDAQYPGGELANYETFYDPTWGRFKAMTHPATGNHEYEGVPTRDSAPGHFGYFGPAAGAEAAGYYSWTLGDWHLFVLNTGAIQYTRTGGGAALPDDCYPVSCAPGSAQETWLRSELEALPAGACAAAYWHHPRVSSGFGGANQPHPETQPLLQALYDHDVELLLTGHSHNYERFEPIGPTGTADSQGVTQFVVGTGGRGFHPITGPQPPESEVLLTNVFGVLELTLGSGSWSSRFVDEVGGTRDSAAGAC